MQNTAFTSRAFRCPAFEPMAPLVGGVESAYAVGFDGSNDYLVTSASIRSPAAGDLTLCGWFYLNSVASLQALFSQLDGTGTGQSWLEITAAAKLQSQLGGSATTGTRTLLVGYWYHFAVTVSGTALTLYVNGLADTTATRTMQAASGVNNIGASKTPGNYFNGRADDLRIYSRALTAAEVQTIYRNSSSPPTSGLVCYFPLDEGTGTTTTDTVGGLVGTLTNGPTWQPQVCPRLRSGRDTTQSWGLSFDGTNDYVDCGTSVLSAGAAEATFALWIKCSANFTSDRYLSKETSTFDTPFIIYNTGSVISFFTSAPSLNQYTDVSFGASTSILNGAWQHLAASVSATTVTTYLNGRAINTSAWTRGIKASSEKTLIAASRWAGVVQWFPEALIKDVRIYSSSLSAPDIAKLANNVEPSATPVGHWKLDEGSGTTAIDSSGNGNHGTLTNGPVYTGDIPQWFRPTIESSYALSCDGINDYVSVAAAIVSAAPCTLMCWFHSSSVAADQTLLSLGQSANETNYFALRAAGAVASDPVQAVASSLSEAAAASASGYTASAWHHAAAVFASTTSRTAYLNGVAGTANTTSKTPASVDATAIGRLTKQTPSEYAVASIDEGCIYSRALTAAEIADAAAGYLVSAGLISRYKLDGNAQDAHGTNHGTEQGGVGYSTSVPGTL